MVFHWNLISSPLKKYQTSSAHIQADPLPTLQNIAAEEGQGTRGNHQYRPSRQSLPLPRYNYNERTRQINGQIHTLILIDFIKKKGLLINLDMVIGTGIICIHHQNTNISITKLVITTVITLMFNIMHIICLL